MDDKIYTQADYIAALRHEADLLSKLLTQLEERIAELENPAERN